MKTTYSILIFLTLFSCRSTKKTMEVNYPKNIEFLELTKSENSGFLTKKQQIITETNEYNEVWGELFSNYMKKPPIPTINFEAKMVILIAMGEKTNGGYSTRVKSITENEDEISILIEEKIPAKNCMTTSVMVYPSQLIEMPTTSKKIIFKVEETIYSCDE